jgi:hypothetical protein
MFNLRSLGEKRARKGERKEVRRLPASWVQLTPVWWGSRRCTAALGPSPLAGPSEFRPEKAFQETTRSANKDTSRIKCKMLGSISTLSSR